MRRNRTAVVPVIAAAAIALSACGSGGGGSASGGAAAEAAAGDSLLAMPAVDTTDGLVIDGEVVHPRRSFRVNPLCVVRTDGLDDDALGDLLLDLVCNDDTCTA